MFTSIGHIGEMHCFPMRYVFYICVAFTVFMFSFFWSQVTHFGPIYTNRNWVLSKWSGREATAHNSTSNTTCCVAQSTPTSTATCTHVDYYELYNRSFHDNNVTLYITCDNIHAGRLGNQMFMYASILGIARAQGRQMFIESKTSLEKTFKISYVRDDVNLTEWLFIKQRSYFNATLMNLPSQNVTLLGYIQSFWYFAAVMDEVRQEFTFHDAIANDAAKILHEVYLKYNASISVGVHVRRGDFLTKKHQKMGYGIAEKSYFEKAFRLMKSKFPGRQMTFLVASDDLTWCSKNLLSNDVYVLPPASASVHLAVLSKCDHMIISGGTYGWWSGWLANGHVIYYTGYMEKGTTLGNNVEIYQYYPRMWIGLGN